MAYENPYEQQQQYTYSGPTTTPPKSVNETVSVGDWIGTFILSAIPIVNLIMLLVWIFSGSTKPSKRNYAKAVIIMALIGVVLGIILNIVFGSMFAELINQAYASGALTSYMVF